MTANLRHFLALAAAAPFAAFAASRALADSTACYDPAALPMSQKGLRKSLQFVDLSPDAAKRCELCAFYKAAAPGCGTCQILNGPVALDSFCLSYAAKPK